MTIRTLLENRLAGVIPAYGIAYENVTFVPVVNVPYLRVHLLLATPNNSIQGSRLYIEQGLFQVKVCWPLGQGAGGAESHGQSIRSHFKRGTTLVDTNGIVVNVTQTPRLTYGPHEDDRYVVIISIPWQSFIST